MIILARVKLKGSTYGYIIESNEAIKFVSKSNMDCKEVQNAFRLKNGEWRAKSGYTIQNIDRSKVGLLINNRNTSIVGKPNLLYNYTFSKLSLTQQKIYTECSNNRINTLVYFTKHTDNIKITMKDMSALTAYSGVEFSLFERPDKYIVVMGTKTGILLDNKTTAIISNGRYNWVGHTHPGNSFNCLIPSDSDYEVLKKLNQKRSVIYNSVGMHYIFGEEDSI